MTDERIKPRRSLLGADVALPQHVVYRSFPSETVILNLETGKYHGLNPTAGRMLEALESCGSVRGAAAQAARLYEQPLEVVEDDLCDLCEALLDRDLLRIESADGG